MEQSKRYPRLNITKKKLIILSVIVFAILVGIAGYKKIFGKNPIASINTVEVSWGDITVSIEGSGVIEPIEMYNITSLATGDILQSNFEEGQDVKKGDLLYVIDTKDIDNTIEKAEVSLEKQKLSHSQTVESYNGLSVTAPISGVITECYVKQGDSVKNGTAIAQITNNDYMILEIPFNSGDAENINIGDTAQVTFENSFYETTGTVEFVSSGEIVLDTGATVSTVKIKVENPGSITIKNTATAIINNMACNSSGIFDYWQQKTVNAVTSGDVVSINYTTGDKVSAGNVILNLESDEAEVSLKQSELSLKDSELALQNTKDQLDDYNITSPIDGTVLQKNSKAGDTLDSSSKSNAMAVIADMSQLTFDIDVDELDIGKIKVGQEVQVTADSLDGKVFEGKISNISKIGTSSSGVATYPVTVVMDNTGDLMIGMNVNAEIVIESKENVLQIPSSALYRGNRVLVKGENGENTYKNVEIGISNADYVEIVSGLEEGDIIVVPNNENTSTNQQMNQGGMTVMPSGGMPNGGGGDRMPQGGGMAPGGGM